MMLPKHPKPEIKHKDGSLWEASYEISECGSPLWAVGLFDKSRSFYFRKLKRNPAKTWWNFWQPEYVRTGETWRGGNLRAAGFSVITTD